MLGLTFICPQLTDTEMHDYVRALLFRFVVGISDLADRNFLRNDGHVISIDEELERRDVNFMKELKPKRCGLIATWLQGVNWTSLDVGGWNIEGCEYGSTERLTLIQTRERTIELFRVGV